MHECALQRILRSRLCGRPCRRRSLRKQDCHDTQDCNNVAIHDMRVFGFVGTSGGLLSYNSGEIRSP